MARRASSLAVYHIYPDPMQAPPQPNHRPNCRSACPDLAVKPLNPAWRRVELSEQATRSARAVAVAGQVKRCALTRFSLVFGCVNAVSAVSGRFSGSDDVSGILREDRASARGGWTPENDRNPSLTPTRPALWLLATILLGASFACAGNDPAGRRSFGPDELHVDADVLQVRAVAASYGNTRLQLTLELHNLADRVLEIDTHACLLGFQQLEYPPVTDDVVAKAPLLALHPMAIRRIELVFDLGRPLVGVGALVFRGIRMDDRWQTPITLMIPGRPGGDVDVASVDLHR